MISYKNIFTYDKNGSVQRLLTPNTHKQELKQIYFILKYIRKGSYKNFNSLKYLILSSEIKLTNM